MNDLGNLEDLTPQARGVNHSEHLEVSHSEQTAIAKLLQSTDGFIVGRLNDELLRYRTDTHLLTISPTGGGKSTGLIIPNLLHHSGSCLVVDIRGETLAKTAMARRMQGHRVVVLDPFEITQGKYGHDLYNPMDMLVAYKDTIEFDAQIERFTRALMFDPEGRKSDEAIWDEATKDLLNGLLELCIRYWPPHRHNLSEVLKVLNYTPKEMKGLIAEIEGIISHDPTGKDHQRIKGLLKIFTENKRTTKITDNALVMAQTFLSWASNKAFKGAIEESSFSFNDLRTGQMTVYLVVPEQYIGSCAIWVRLLLESAVFSVPEVFGSLNISTSELRQDQRILFLLDELPAFGKMDLVSVNMATLRGRGINLWLFVQNMSQLEATYGKEIMRTVMANISCMQVFESDELEELEYLTRLIGEEFHDVQSVTINGSKTEGSSVATGHSRAISNSESFSSGTNSSDTTSEASTVNWNQALSKSRNTNVAKTSNQSVSGGRNKSSNSNRGNTSALQYDRNLIWSSRTGRSTNSNHGSGHSSGSNTGWQKGSGKTVSEGEGTSDTESYGGGQTATDSHTEGVNEQHTRQYGETNTESTTHTEQESTTSGWSVSVKMERMKLETVRSLRAKLSGRNQLIKIRGHQPFFTPRMSYFAKFQDEDRYMFPDLVSMGSEESVYQINGKIPKLWSEVHNPKKVLEDFTEYRKIAEILRMWDEGEMIYYSEAVPEYKDFLQRKLAAMVEACEEYLSSLRQKSLNLNEGAKTLLCMAGLLKRSGVEGFDQMEEKLMEHMQKLVPLCSYVIPTKQFEDYSKLPLIKIEDRALTQNYYDSEDIFNQTLGWLFYNYTPVFLKIRTELAPIGKQMELLYNEYLLTSRFLKEGLKMVQLHTGQARDKVIDQELRMKHEYYINRYAK